MKRTPFLLLASAVALAGACAPLSRSRDVGDPAVPPTAIAQQVCSNCHSIDGNSASPNFPRLASQPAPYIESQLKLFRSQARSDPEGFEYMWGLSRRLSDQQIAGLAKYFAEQSPHGNRPGPVELSQQGQEIFENGIAAQNVPPCKACHGAHGEGHDLFPRLAGQHASYIEKQLAVFQFRAKQRPDAGPMEVVSHSLTQDNVKAIAAYVQGLR